MGECKYMDGKSCNFEHEPTKEDCMLCMPNVILIHVNVLLNSVCAMDVKFGQARNIYVAFAEIQEAQKGFVKLMESAYPEAIKRAKIPKIEPQTRAVV